MPSMEKVIFPGQLLPMKRCPSLHTTLPFVFMAVPCHFTASDEENAVLLLPATVGSNAVRLAHSASGVTRLRWTRGIPR